MEWTDTDVVTDRLVYLHEDVYLFTKFFTCYKTAVLVRFGYTVFLENNFIPYLVSLSLSYTLIKKAKTKESKIQSVHKYRRTKKPTNFLVTYSNVNKSIWKLDRQLVNYVLFNYVLDKLYHS